MSKKFLMMMMALFALGMAACGPASPTPASTKDAVDSGTVIPSPERGEMGNVPDGVTGVTWQWTGMASADTVTDIPNPENYNVVFNEDGTATIKADCNDLEATYTWAGDPQIFPVPENTETCAMDSLGEQFSTLLGQVAAGGPDGDGGLVLETVGGGVRLIFAAQ